MRARARSLRALPPARRRCVRAQQSPELRLCRRSQQRALCVVGSHTDADTDREPAPAGIQCRAGRAAVERQPKAIPTAGRTRLSVARMSGSSCHLVHVAHPVRIAVIVVPALAHHCDCRRRCGCRGASDRSLLQIVWLSLLCWSTYRTAGEMPRTTATIVAIHVRCRSPAIVVRTTDCSCVRVKLLCLQRGRRCLRPWICGRPRRYSWVWRQRR